MATLQELQALSQGQQLNFPSNQNQQTIVVNNPGQVVETCLSCDENVCEVAPTQAVTLDLGRFNSSNSTIRFNVDTTQEADPTVAENMTFFAGFHIGDLVNFPKLQPFIDPQLGLTGSNTRGPIVTAVTAASANLVSAGDFLPSDVGSTIVDTSGVNIAPGTTIIAFIDSSNVTMSSVGLNTGASTIFLTSPTGFAFNGALINSRDAAPLMAEFNSTLEGGYVIGKITIQYNSTTYPELSGIVISTIHEPVRPSDSVVEKEIFTPLCDACTTNNNGQFTTHTYLLSGVVTYRDLVNIFIPGSEAGSKFVVDICLAGVGIPNHQVGTYGQQAA